MLVRFKKALRLQDMHCWDMDQVTSALIEQRIIDGAQEDEILASCDTQALFAAIEAAGYDAVLYQNETEGRLDAHSDSLLVWRARQIKSVHASSFLEGDPRLCPTLPIGADEKHWWEGNERDLETWLRLFVSRRKVEDADHCACLPA